MAAGSRPATAASWLLGRKEYGDLVSTFVGWDTLILSSLVSGAAGVMAGTANLIPGELVAVHDRVQEGDLTGAREAWARVHQYLDAALSTSYIAAVKAGLDAIGHSAGPPAALQPAPGDVRQEEGHVGEPQECGERGIRCPRPLDD